MISVSPELGDVGSFTVASPYNQMINPLKEYKVESIRSIQDMTDSNENPLKIIYTDHELTIEDMARDIKNNVKIIVLTDSAGGYGYIPETKFLTVPDITGIRYQEKALAINLGLHEVDVDRTTLINDISALIKSRTGMDVNIQEIDASAIIRVPVDKHREIQSVRKALITISPGYYYNYLECMETKRLLEETNNRLSCVLSKQLQDTMSPTATLNPYALNGEHDLTPYKVSLASTIKLDGSVGVEVRTNEFVIYDKDPNDRSIKIVSFNSSTVTVIRSISITYASIRHQLYVMNGYILSIYYTGTRMSYRLYDLDLSELSSGNIGTYSNTDYAFPIQVEDNKLTLGVIKNNSARVIYISTTNVDTVSLSEYEISNTNTANSILINDNFFTVLSHGNNGSIIFNDHTANIDISSDGTSLTRTTVYTSLNHSTNEVVYFMNVVDGTYTICLNHNNDIHIRDIYMNNTKVNAYINTTYDLDTSAILITKDRSLLLATEVGDQTIQLKKYV